MTPHPDPSRIQGHTLTLSPQRPPLPLRGPVPTRLPCTSRAQTPSLHRPPSAAQRGPPLTHQGLARGRPTHREGPGHVQVRRLTQDHASRGHPRACGQGPPSRGFPHQSRCFTLSSPPTPPPHAGDRGAPAASCAPGPTCVHGGLGSFHRVTPGTAAGSHHPAPSASNP